MGPVHASTHHCLSLEIFQCLVRIAFAAKLAVFAVSGPEATVRSPQRLAPAMGATRRQRDLAVEATVQAHRGRTARGVQPFASIADNVLVDVAPLVIVVSLALASGGAEETLLALAAAAHARRIVRVVDAAEVASDFAPAAGDAGLVDALVLSCPSRILLLLLLLLLLPRLLARGGRLLRLRAAGRRGSRRRRRGWTGRCRTESVP